MGTSGYAAATAPNQARLVDSVFSRGERIASPSAPNSTEASCSKKTRIAWRTSPTRGGYPVSSAQALAEACDAETGDHPLVETGEPLAEVEGVGRLVVGARLDDGAFGSLLGVERGAQQRGTGTAAERVWVDHEAVNVDRRVRVTPRDGAEEPVVGVSAEERLATVLQRFECLVQRRNVVVADQLGLDRVGAPLQGEQLRGSVGVANVETNEVQAGRLGPVGSVRAHERIAVVGRRHERLLHGPRADPADQVPERAGLVVRAGRARSPEGLLADDGPRGLVVDVEVAGGVAERCVRLLDGVAVVGEDGARERVRRAGVDELERVRPALVVVDVGGDDGPEQLLVHRPVAGILRLDHGRLDEVPVRVV